MKMKEKLRVGVLVDSNLVPSWAYRMLERIEGSDYAEIALLVRNGASTATSRNLFQKIKSNWRNLLYILFANLDSKLEPLDPDPFVLQDIRPLLKNTACISVEPKQTKFSDYLTKDDAERIKVKNIDVLIRLGFRILRGEFLECSKYGVWSYHHGDNQTNRGGRAGFWEVVEGWPETGSVLQILTEDLDGGKTLYKSYSKTDIPLVNRNRGNYYWKTLSFIPRTLRELHELGEEKFLSRVREDSKHPNFYSRRLYAAPSNIELLGLALKLYSKYLWTKLQSLLYFDQWILLYQITPSSGFSSSFWRFRKMIPPKDRFWADPFVVSEKDKFYIFIEEFVYRSNKGHIAYLTMDRDGNYSAPKKAIEKPYHLSYPFVFSYDGEYYMIPESKENRIIELYRCVEFPDKWRLKRVLMRDVYAVDTTALHSKGRWWIFTNIRENEGASIHDELFLFYSSDLFSENWTPHPRNPIVSDVRSARSAGRIFSYNGSLYRPSQDNSKRYGYGMKINQIVTLTESEYREVCVNDIEPLWDKRIVGTHTLNHSEGLTIIDGLMKRPRHLC